MSTHEPNQHCLTSFSSIYHFLTIPGMWLVGWMGEIKIKDHLSSAEAEIRAELGNSEGGWGKSRLMTISVQLKLKLGLSLAIDTIFEEPHPNLAQAYFSLNL